MKRTNLKNLGISFLTCLLILLFSHAAFSADYYIAQTAVGSADGSSCANAKAVNWNWTSPNVVEGDTVHLCGTFTSTLTIPRTFNAPGVTVKFLPGAKFSKPAWGITTGSAIYASGKSNITIDGNNVGIIENTSNGTALSIKQESFGIHISGGSNIVVKNLTIKELYKRTPRVAGDSNKFGKGVYTVNSSNVTVNNNTIYGMYYAILHTASSGNPSGLNIHHNDISQMSTGIVVRLDGSTNYSDVNIFNNKIFDAYVWGGCWGGTGADLCTGGSWNHKDGIHTWGNYSGYRLGPINIYGNEFSGDWGIAAQTTSYIYLTDYTYPISIYNNLMVANVEPPSNGFIGLHTYGVGSADIFNNTVVSTSSTNKGGTITYITGSLGTWTVDIKNNIFSNAYIGIYNNTSNASVTSDNNIFHNLGSVGRSSSAWHSSLSAWQSYLGGCPGVGNECNGFVADPRFTSMTDFRLKPDSPAIDAGVQLTSSFTTDKDGNIRSGLWDIGAYQYSTGGSYSYSLSITKSGSGTVTGSYINCGSTCSNTYYADSIETLTAVPASGYNFAGWSGACSGAGTCSVTMNTNKAVTATFTVNSNYALSVNKSGTGTITSNPSGINCGSTCSYSYPEGELVTLTANPGTGYTFSNWSGACSGTGTCSVTMSQARSVTATFAVVPQQPGSYSLAVSKIGTGAGSVESAPAGIDCGSTCSAAFSSGTGIQLTAAPDANSTFAGWSGACTGTTACTFSMNANKTVTATFTTVPVASDRKTLTVIKNGNGKVKSVSTVSASLNALDSSEIEEIDCGDICSAEYPEGASVTLQAELDEPGYSFSGWSGGGCSGTGLCNVTVDDSTSVTATFAAASTGGTPSVALSADGGGGGGCFIATAAFGSYLDPHVMVLRAFRDKVLMQNGLGKQVVKLYYKHSPPVADSIAQNETLRTAARLALTPLIYAVAYPDVALAILLSMLLALLIVRKRKMDKLEKASISMSDTYFEHGPRRAFFRVR